MAFMMIILASYRLTHLIVFDKIAEPLRNLFLTKKETRDHEIKKVPKSMIGYLLTCYWCTGIWSAILLCTMYLFLPTIANYIIFILAIAGGQAILETFVGVNIKRTELYNEQIEYCTKSKPPVQ
ncbi:DUF1360 domain-containing protein [Bacillus sp. DTU_2020_1000418_1_SI_GHA_SEK_038]|uniref:DUF1360 domain-containing protein n=1 Tax=Bacillus sp. DTU_2020_1000418_1_SI_GHA_SEK_038 TaxID=3077585 RepID=UPI0028E50E98|nr:DUF1360 domain-containing protein [Bacillus sp. DTU_2020_1000418_1_SI_GHA_SEK_038]WNS77545.1 DUF1360 domain-containing protein [Bacillus sp. DTU_2020_1000418_1_SI_GHA_SEK_038]